MVFGLVGRQSMVGSGEAGEFGSLCFKLPEILSMLRKLIENKLNDQLFKHTPNNV